MENDVSNKNNDDIIWHYTSMETLLIILQNRTMRFTNATCLNDSKELTWVLHKLEEELKLIERNNSTDSNPIFNFILSNDPNINVKKQIHNIFSMLLGNNEEREKNAPYTISFSHSGDILSQWRAYGNDGMGVSIGFKKVELLKLLSDVP